MKKCTVKLISFAAVAVGSFMMGIGVGYSFKKDEEYYEKDGLPCCEYFESDDEPVEDIDSKEKIKELNLAKSYISKYGYDPAADTDGDNTNEIDYWAEAKKQLKEIDDDGSYSEETVTDRDGVSYRMTDEGLVEVKDPYFITEEEYFETQRDFEKTPIIYYAKDGIYADIRDEMIRNINLFPEDCHVGFETDEVVYVRNVKIGTDFEISKVDQSYWDDVLGVVEKHNIFDDDRKE